MRELTPLVEPLSLDEAYLDLSGTERLHGLTPAKTMAKLAKRIESELGITASIGLSHNKFLAKLASELDKPRGFAVIGKAEAKTFLRDKPVGFIRGAGKALQARLAKDGITRIGQLQDMDVRKLAQRYGNTGLWLSSPRAGRRYPRRRSLRRNENDFVRDDVRQRHRAARRSRKHPVEPGRARFDPRQGLRSRRPHHRAQAQDREFQDPHAQRVARIAHATRRPHLPHRARLARA
jgi:DNA polymerase-4